jgi:hypothetical protein
MIKKITIAIIFLLLLLAGLSYFKPLQATELLAAKETLPQTINTSIFFSAHEQKELAVTGEKAKQEIMDFIDNIKVRRSLGSPDSYQPKFKSTYMLTLVTDSNEVEIINILNNDYLELNHKTYRIVGTPDLSSLYSLIMLDQPAGSLNQYYYDLIDKSE